MNSVPVLTVKPWRALFDEKFHVVVGNLPPTQEVTLHSLHQSEDTDYWEAFGNYVSDAQGRDTGPGPFPGVLDMWGGGGSLVEYRAALLASHGFAAMTIIYLFPDHKKNTTIGYPYFENAFRLPQDHPLVATDRIALLGISAAVPVVLSITAYSKTVKPRCCVCISGTHTGRIEATQSIAEAYSRIEKLYKKACRDEKNHIIWRDVFLPIPEDIDLKVEMGRITCPLLLVVGQDDQNNATVESADDMKQMMERAGNSNLLTTLSYPGAGHLIEMPYSPHCKVSSFLKPLSRERVLALWGGLTKPHAVAQEDSWEKILGFLREHLCHSVKPHVQSRL